MIRALIYLVLIVVFSTCTSGYEKKSTLPEIMLNPDENVVDNVLYIIDELEIIPVITNSLPFRNPTKGVKYNDFFIFNDGMYTGNFIIINANGEFVRRINRLGDNYDEYKEVTCFSVTSKGDLEVYDGQKQRFIYYDMQGNYLRKQNIGFNFTSYKRKDSTTFIFTAKHENFINGKQVDYDILVINNNKITNKYFPFEPKQFNSVRIHNLKPFVIFNDGLLYSDNLLDTVYYLTHDSIKPIYLFKYANEYLPKSITSQGHEELVNLLKYNPNELAKYDFSSVITAGDNSYLFYAYIHNMQNIFGVYSISSNIGKEVFFDADEAGLNSLLTPFFVHDGKFITVVPLYALQSLLKNINRNENIETASIIESLIENSSDLEQSILLKYKIKPF